MAAGLASDLLGTTLLATTAPVAVAPAMHTEMWRHPATTANIEYSPSETLKPANRNVVSDGIGMQALSATISRS